MMFFLFVLFLSGDIIRDFTPVSARRAAKLPVVRAPLNLNSNNAGKTNVQDLQDNGNFNNGLAGFNQNFEVYKARKNSSSEEKSANEPLNSHNKYHDFITTLLASNVPRSKVAQLIRDHFGDERDLRTFLSDLYESSSSFEA